MSQVIRRHWVSTLILVMAIVAVALWMGGGLMGRFPRAGAAAPAPMTPLAVSGRAAARIKDVRARLCLRAEDLAALGCTGQQSRQVLAALVAYDQQNGQVLEAAYQNEQQAKRSLQAVWQKIHVGPKDDGVIAQLPLAEQQYRGATQAKENLMDGAIASVTPLLNGGQAGNWATARANAAQGAPTELRYVPALTAQQINAWRQTRKQNPGIVTALGVQTLWGPQIAAEQAALANQKLLGPEVQATERQTFPPTSVNGG